MRTVRRVQGHKCGSRDTKRDVDTQSGVEGHRGTCLSDNRGSLKFHIQIFLPAGAPQLLSQAVADVDAGAVPAGDLCCAGHTAATFWHGQLICMDVTYLGLTKSMKQHMDIIDCMFCFKSLFEGTQRTFLKM